MEHKKLLEIIVSEKNLLINEEHEKGNDRWAKIGILLGMGTGGLFASTQVDTYQKLLNNNGNFFLLLLISLGLIFGF